MNNYEPFYSSYTRIQYGDYKSDKLKTPSEISTEQEKALSYGVDEISMITFFRQSNGGYEGRKKKFFHENGGWIAEH